MNYAQILEALENATLFDLYRLRVAIDQQIDDPQRQMQVKRLLRLGEIVDYFDPTENRIVKARVLKLLRSNVDVADETTGKRWRVPYYMFNLAGADTRWRVSYAVLFRVLNPGAADPDVLEHQPE